MPIDTTGYTTFAIDLDIGDVAEPQALEVRIDPTLNDGAEVLCVYTGTLLFGVQGTAVENWSRGNLVARIPTPGRLWKPASSDHGPGWTVFRDGTATVSLAASYNAGVANHAGWAVDAARVEAVSPSGALPPEDHVQIQALLARTRHRWDPLSPVVSGHGGGAVGAGGLKRLCHGDRSYRSTSGRIRIRWLSPCPSCPTTRRRFGDVLSAETFEYHYGKHHKAYVDTLNGCSKPARRTSRSRTSSSAPRARSSTRPPRSGTTTCTGSRWRPAAAARRAARPATPINEAFGSYDKFREEFKTSATGQFGSGWAWLTLDGGKLAISSTGNADLPMKHGQTAVLTCDVWEHAYYIDYRNERPGLRRRLPRHLINWSCSKAALLAADRRRRLVRRRRAAARGRRTSAAGR